VHVENCSAEGYWQNTDFYSIYGILEYNCTSVDKQRMHEYNKNINRAIGNEAFMNPEWVY